MDKILIKEALITLTAATLITFGAVSAIADDYLDDDSFKKAAYIVRTVEQSNSTIPLLIRKAEKAGRGIAIEVEVEENEDGQYIEIDLFRNCEILQVKCSLTTGEILNVGQPEFLPTLISRISERYASLKNHTISMEKAVRLAEINTSGTAYRAEVEDIDGWLCYKIHIFTYGRTMQVMIDPDTGRIVSHRDLDRNDHGKNK